MISERTLGNIKKGRTFKLQLELIGFVFNEIEKKERKKILNLIEKCPEINKTIFEIKEKIEALNIKDTNEYIAVYIFKNCMPTHLIGLWELIDDDKKSDEVFSIIIDITENKQNTT